MKKLMVLCCLALLVGCQSEDLENGMQHPVGNRTLVASIEGQDYADASRTAVDDNGNVTWIDTDKLGVYGATSKNLEYSSTGNGSDVTFTGNMPETDEAQWAYYPYEENASFSEGKLTVTLPDSYEYTGNSNAPMLGKKTGDNKFAFKHLGGLIRFTLGGGIPENAGRFVITSTGVNQPIAGQATFEVEGENVTMTITADAKQSVSYDVSAIEDAGEFQHFFVPLPVGSYDKLEVSFYLKNATDPVFTRSVSNLNVVRAQMVSMPILDWKTGKQYELNENTKDITDLVEGDGVTVTLVSESSLQLTGAEESQLPQKEEIIWSKPTEELPYGFMGKVTEVTEADGTVTITTESVALDEVFDELLIEETVDLVPTADSRSTSTAIGVEKTYTMPIEIQDEGSAYGINGELNIVSQLRATIHVNKEKSINRMDFSLTFNPNLEAKMAVGASFNEDQEMIPFELKDFNFPPITLGGGVFTINPALQFKLYIAPSGEISFKTDVKYNTTCVAGADYQNGQWQYGINEVNHNSQSPWEMTSTIDMNASLFLGAGVEFKGKIYNRDDLKIYIEPIIGIELSGELEIKSDDDNMQESLKDAALTTENVASGKFGIDATVLAEQAEASFDFKEKRWGEKQLYVLPMFENLAAQVKTMSLGSRSSTDPFEATITMTAVRELLFNYVSISTTIINEQQEKDTQTADYINYEIVGDDNPSQNFSMKFEYLDPESSYRGYPIVYNPTLEKTIELSEEYVSFHSPARDLRDQLVLLYKNAGGENWTNNENWCSDKPIEEWYGIYESVDGKYSIFLPDNNLTGTVSLSSPEILGVVVDKNQIENICLAGCANLEMYAIDQNPLVTLDLSGCKLIDISVNNLNIETLRELRLRNCTQITELSQIYSALDTLDLSGCENLEYFPSSSVNWSGLSYVNISGCKLIEKLAGLYDAQLKYLNISECTSLSDISSVDFETLEEFHAKNCTNLNIALNFSNIKVLDIENCSSIESIYVDPQSEKLTDINIKGCSSLTYLSCYNGLLTSINLEGCDKLETLYCSGNQLSQLDLSKCPLLKDVQCGDNQLTDIDVTNNTELEKLWCDNNELTSLDLTYNTQLKELHCDYNQLQSLDFFSNPLMEKIYCENNAISTIRLDKCGQLTYLTCRNNQLTSLNISQNKNLENLYCSNNKLSELDFTKLSNLSSFEGKNLNIKDVDVSNLTSLSYFSCTSDYLQSVNLEGCLNLKSLHISGPITDFNHGMCNALETINISNTNLSSLDLDGYSALTNFTCRNNGQLESLNLSGCTSMITLGCADNPMLSDLTLMTYAPLESVSFLNTKVSMEIPAFFPLYDSVGSLVFHYVQRYTDYQWVTNTDGTKTITYNDNGYGWWFPGEPDSGTHSR